MSPLPRFGRSWQKLVPVPRPSSPFLRVPLSESNHLPCPLGFFTTWPVPLPRFFVLFSCEAARASFLFLCLPIQPPEGFAFISGPQVPMKFCSFELIYHFFFAVGPTMGSCFFSWKLPFESISPLALPTFPGISPAPSPQTFVLRLPHKRCGGPSIFYTASCPATMSSLSFSQYKSPLERLWPVSTTGFWLYLFFASKRGQGDPCLSPALLRFYGICSFRDSLFFANILFAPPFPDFLRSLIFSGIFMIYYRPF